VNPRCGGQKGSRIEKKNKKKTEGQNEKGKKEEEKDESSSVVKARVRQKSLTMLMRLE
jgi:hypothetical protein